MTQVYFGFMPDLPCEKFKVFAFACIHAAVEKQSVLAVVARHVRDFRNAHSMLIYVLYFYVTAVRPMHYKRASEFARICFAYEYALDVERRKSVGKACDLFVANVASRAPAEYYYEYRKRSYAQQYKRTVYNIERSQCF